MGKLLQSTPHFPRPCMSDTLEHHTPIVYVGVMPIYRKDHFSLWLHRFRSIYAVLRWTARWAWIGMVWR